MKALEKTRCKHLTSNDSQEMQSLDAFKIKLLKI